MMVSTPVLPFVTLLTMIEPECTEMVLTEEQAKRPAPHKKIKIYLQKVSNVTVGEEQQRKVEVIESLILGDAFEIKEDEEKTIDFVMPLQFNKPDAASVNVKGWTVSFGASNPLEIDVFSSSSTWVEVMATVDLEGVAIDPTSTQRLTIF